VILCEALCELCGKKNPNHKVALSKNKVTQSEIKQ
jgi:hypothetical protein